MITLNLHINYDCPLSCRYCCQRQNPNLLEAYFSAEEMIEIVQKFMAAKKVEKCNINISKELKSNYLKNLKSDGVIIMIDDDNDILYTLMHEAKNVVIFQDSVLVD